MVDLVAPRADHEQIDRPRLIQHRRHGTQLDDAACFGVHLDPAGPVAWLRGFRHFLLAPIQVAAGLVPNRMMRPSAPRSALSCPSPPRSLNQSLHGVCGGAVSFTVTVIGVCVPGGVTSIVFCTMRLGFWYFHQMPWLVSVPNTSTRPSVSYAVAR